MARYDDMNNQVIGVIGFVAVMLTLAMVFFFQALYYGYRDSIEGPLANRGPNAPEIVIQRNQRARLAEYGWIDREKKITSLPIGKAMELVVQETSAKAP
ncbi:hypothetical protein [Planctellipticum variicoloris]|uniref:hypothetical protein n=1 Tax=Planctellipticum variicoloris TaxID=3064265 RepID=UPI002CACBFC9|nr:hypothetical protein SH412_005157 [Planctomycetaceae bacterium SH412]HTN03157.1 hypothetical protein [Planctomycetaceae bacterium]